MTAHELLIEFNRVMKLMPCACIRHWVKDKWEVTKPCVGYQVMAKYDAFLLTEGT